MIEDLGGDVPLGLGPELGGDAQGGLLDSEELGGGPPRPVLGCADQADHVAALRVTARVRTGVPVAEEPE